MDIEKRYISPTVVRDVKGDDSLMSEYVSCSQSFAPVLCFLYVGMAMSRLSGLEGWDYISFIPFLVASTLAARVGRSNVEPYIHREIFGPVLPVVPVDSIDDAIKFVNARYVRSPSMSNPQLYFCSAENIPSPSTSSLRTTNLRLKVPFHPRKRLKFNGR